MINETASTQALANTYITFLAFLASVVAAWFAWKGYQLKSGVHLHGSYTTASSVNCADTFVSSVTLANLKDRAVVVFRIILEFDHGYYLELENQEATPLVIEPFQVVHRMYDPIEHYSGGLRRIGLEALFAEPQRSRRLVVVTPEGRYAIRRSLSHWEPAEEYFKNHLTWILNPSRLAFRGVRWGSNIRYVVELVGVDGISEDIPVNGHYPEMRSFRDFKIPIESLRSSEALEAYLTIQAKEGNLRCEKFVVHNLETHRTAAYADFRPGKMVARPRAWALYHICGPAYTWWSNARLQWMNWRNQRRR